ncbi:CDP-alcohol phosphatidyltransferase family protein [Thermaurantiacus sp.]
MASTSRLLALVSAGDAVPGERRSGLQHVAGQTILERQVRLALRAGAHAVLIVSPPLPAELERRLSRQGPVTQLSDSAALATQLSHAQADLLLLEPGAVVDERLVESIAAEGEGGRVLVFDCDPPPGAERIGSSEHWASVARLPAKEAAAALARHPEWEPVATLLRAALAGGAALVPVESLSTYSEGRRRKVPFVWAKPAAAGGRAEAEQQLLAAAQKGCLDWPARFLHPPIENALVRLLWPTPVTPNMVTLATALLGVVALALIASGALLSALLLILVIGPLDGVDGKLARTRIEFSRWGDLEHVLDKLLEYGWFAAFGFWFAGVGHGLAAMLAAFALILFAFLEAVHGEIFRRITGRQLDDWGSFERRFRLIAGRRNTFFWTLLPFGLAGLWWQGFLVLLAYAAVTFAVAHWRFLRGLLAFLRREAPSVRRNLEVTRYAFLPKSGRQGS